MPCSWKNVGIHPEMCIYEVTLQAICHEPSLFTSREAIALLLCMVLGDALQQKRRSAGGDVEESNGNHQKYEEIGQTSIRKAANVAASLVGQ